jgi:hypothetical protein
MDKGTKEATEQERPTKREHQRPATGEPGAARSETRAHRRTISYIDRTREFYGAQGFTKPYRWATHTDAPFTRPRRASREATVAVVTTAFPHRHDLPPDEATRDGKQAYARAVTDLPESMFTDDLSWDKNATHTNDLGTFLPLDHLATLEQQGRIGRAGPRWYGAPTEYSRRRTGNDAVTIARWCAEDEVDIVLLIPL